MVIISENYEEGVPKKRKRFAKTGLTVRGLPLPVKQPTSKTAIQKVRFFLGHPVLRGRKGIRSANPSARNLTTCNGLRATTLPSKDEAVAGVKDFLGNHCAAHSTPLKHEATDLQGQMEPLTPQESTT